MSLASTGFCAPVRQTGTPKPVGAFSARLCGRSRRAKTSRPAPLPRGTPLGVTVFANARINKQHHNPASHHECKNARHRDSTPTPHTAERYTQLQN